MTTKIEKALVDAVRTLDKPPKGGWPNPKAENRQDYLDAIVQGIRVVDEDTWESLEKTPGAQEWYTAAVAAMDSHEDIVDFSDDVIGGDPNADTDKPETAAKPGPGRPKSTEPKAEKTTKPKKEPTGDGRTAAVTRMRELLLDDMTLSPKDLMQKMRDEGYSPADGAVNTTRSDFLHTCRFLAKHGKIKGLDIPESIRKAA